MLWRCSNSSYSPSSSSHSHLHPSPPTQTAISPPAENVNDGFSRAQGCRRGVHEAPAGGAASEKTRDGAQTLCLRARSPRRPPPLLAPSSSRYASPKLESPSTPFFPPPRPDRDLDRRRGSKAASLFFSPFISDGLHTSPFLHHASKVVQHLRSPYRRRSTSRWRGKLETEKFSPIYSPHCSVSTNTIGLGDFDPPPDSNATRSTQRRNNITS